ncbi:TonB-dependent hemoglobin/transferrin/lactoferrin family receptor [Hyphomicrobium sp. LHD-15]|uniref:TonB-dependent receptor n=1 Tax=Hyphomicrobium sp. LHD-15 TaxID=3072142 RepID=UPI00280C7DD7|nr:TonB-dependent hemoglobin/transferrin/lactoferrin family receptor [Hyphomicrobium sp. LHD-15]MDQ8699547.1 TonB-dependent hemoglobin/transferrin/lactoferrin family receptor [Hyphomicrobium sp. LHD-15]
MRSSRRGGEGRAAWVHALAAAVALSSSLAPSHGALAQTSQAPAGKQRSFSVPAGSVSAALVAFGKQAGVQVSYVPSVAAGLTTSGVNGTLSPDAALSQILAGTGLSFKMTGAKTVVIEGSAGGSSEAATLPGAIALDTIDVGGSATGAGYQGTPDWVYETPASVSVVTREAIQARPTRDTRDLLANAAGVYAGEGNGSFPTVSPNIRGLQDSGRVVVSLNGARLNAQRGMSFGAGSGSYQSNSGQAFVDSAFIREVDISKATGAKAGDAASLGGSVAFRTIGADDLIAPGATTGVEINMLRGTNEYDFQGSALAAVRISESLALTGGFSKLKVGEYEPGKEGDAYAFNNSLGRDTWSSLLQLEFDNREDFKASIMWMRQDLGFSYANYNDVGNHQDVLTDTVTAMFDWDPSSELIKAKATLWLNDTRTDELRDSRRSGGATSQPPDTFLDLDHRSFGGTLENTSRIETALGGLTLNYGAEAFRDKANSSATSETIAENPLWETSYTAFNPPGQRDVASGFFNGELKPASWITLSGGVRYDWSRLKGTPSYYDTRTTSTSTPDILAQAVTTWGAWAQVNNVDLYNLRRAICDTGINPRSGRAVTASQRASTCATFSAVGEAVGLIWYNAGSVKVAGTTTNVTTYPEYELDIDRTDGAWLPSAIIELKPVDWFRPYASYSQSFRPPTILESFLMGGTPGDAVGTAFAPNVSLRPETGETFEIGANISRNGVIRDDDTLRVKAAAFHREIDDYIVMGTIYTDDVSTRTYSSFVNMDGPTTMRGIELEGNYDMRVAYVGAAATWLDTEWAKKTELFSNGTTTTNGDVFAVAGNVPPEFKLTVDAGLRFFDERLTLGGRYTYTTPTQTRQVVTIGSDLVVVDSTDPYSVWDLYGSYRFDEHTTLRVSVDNITDQRYVPAGGLFLAPGRTATASFQLKF